MTTRQMSEGSNPEETTSTFRQNRLYSRLNSSIFDLLPRQADRQSLHAAIIHSAAILFVIVCGACAWLAYQILEPFLRSILWSILAGAFLFPCKRHLTSRARSYLKKIEEDSHLLIYGLFVLLPIQTIDRIIESVGEFFWNKVKYLAMIIALFLLNYFFSIESAYIRLVTFGHNIFLILLNIFHFFESKFMTAVVLLYIIAVLTFYHYSWWTKTVLNIIAIPIWLILLIHLSQYLPVAYQLTVVILAITLTILGLMVDVKEYFEQNLRESILSNLLRKLHQSTRREERTVEDRIELSASSTPYFKLLFWGFFTLKIYQFYEHIIGIAILFIIYKMIKYSLIKIYQLLIRQPSVIVFCQNISEFFRARQDVLMPSTFHGLGRFLVKGDQKFNVGLQVSIDYLISALMIITLLVSVLIGTILLIIQIRHESIHMIKLAGNLVNETIARQPSFQYLLPEKERMGGLMDSAVNNFYIVGRRWITNQVNTLNSDSSSTQRLEEEILQLWDRAYSYMVNTSSLLLATKNQSTSPIVYPAFNWSFTFQSLLKQFSFNLDFLFTDIYRLIQANLGLLRTVFDAIWSNATLLLTLFSTIISVLFTGGFVLFNFFVAFIVFVTLLFYLLSHSDKAIYPPTEWLNNTLTIGGRNLGQAVNDAVTSVFVASLKIAAFYGLYTYVLHTLVGSNLVFLPVVIASICAVTLKSYWAALPGCLDLWLVQRRPIVALLLLVGQILPVYVVDTAIYSEVKGGGHQYLTALAIAGGVYYRGIEGALIGPIVLCCLLVGVRLYNETMARTLSVSHEQFTDSLRQRSRSIHRSRSLQMVPTHFHSQENTSSFQ